MCIELFSVFVFSPKPCLKEGSPDTSFWISPCGCCSLGFQVSRLLCTGGRGSVGATLRCDRWDICGRFLLFFSHSFSNFELVRRRRKTYLSRSLGWNEWAISSASSVKWCVFIDAKASVLGLSFFYVNRGYIDTHIVHAQTALCVKSFVVFRFEVHQGWRSSLVLFIRRHFAITGGILHAGFRGLIAKFEACSWWDACVWESF